MLRTVLLVSVLLLTLVLSQDNEDIIIGIDLGTTYSCVSYWESRWDRVEIIPNEMGQMITPSVIAFNPENGELLVGSAAKNQAAMNPTNTVYDAKRFVGRRFDDPDIQDDIKKLPCKVVNVNNRPVFRLEIMGKEKDFTPEEISALVLQQIKQSAETYIGRRVTRAVITVPAYFNNAQRQATRAAGKIAGLKVARIINEPTAAAVAFGLRSKRNLNVLVFDLGGGTFDVSLMTIDNGVYDVIATSGDMHLGGEDFDHEILDQLVLEFEKKHGYNLIANPRAIQKLKRATEEAKKALSSEKHTEETIYIDSLYRGIDFQFKLTRARLEHVNERAFRRTLLPVEAVLKRSGMNKHEVDNILLVGGSTRIPKVKQLLSDFFGGRQLTQEVQPDFVVSQGAAIVGAVIAKKIKHEIQLTDVLSQALGTQIASGEMVTILETNIKIPSSGSKFFTTVQDNQKSVIVGVFQGEHKLAKNNQFLGEFVLSGIPPMKKGIPSIETTFSVDREGILHVTAVEGTTGAKNSITIKDSLMLSDDEVSDAEIRHRDLVARNQAIHNFNAELNKADDKIRTVSAKIRVTLENIRNTYETWFKEHPEATLRELDVKRESLLADIKASTSRDEL